MIVDNFIGIKENALSAELCLELIEHINEKFSFAQSLSKEEMSEQAIGYGVDQFENGALSRSDFQVFQPDNSYFRLKEITNCIFDGLNEYKQFVSTVGTIGPLVNDVVKLQYTAIGGGFHKWHTEQSQSTTSNRSLAWLIYLNDVAEGGETEFLYQQQRHKPKQGTLVIFPAGITHPHRGNPPYSNDKYIATGWFTLPSTESHSLGVSALKEQGR